MQAESRAEDLIRAAGSSFAEKPAIFPPARCRPDEIITELHLPTWLSGRVADRILRYAAIARENVVAGTDYGLGGRVYADLMQDVVLSETEKAHRPVPSIRRHKRATTRLTAPAYWKFESSPLQRRVCKLLVPWPPPGITPLALSTTSGLSPGWRPQSR